MLVTLSETHGLAPVDSLEAEDFLDDGSTYISVQSFTNNLDFVQARQSN